MRIKKRYPVTKSGLAVTPEVAEALAKEAEEDIDPADFTLVYGDGPMVREQGRFWWFRLRIRGHFEEAWWRVEGGVKAVRKFGREATHRHAKV
jgi:hypothetical protein